MTLYIRGNESKFQHFLHGIPTDLEFIVWSILVVPTVESVAITKSIDIGKHP